MQYFQQEMITDAKKQRAKTIWFYTVVAFIFAFISVGLFLWYRTMPYQDSRILTVKIIHYTLTGIFVIFSFIYFAIKYKRINAYYKSVVLMSEGIRETSEGSFFEYSNEIEEKDGVDFKALIFIEWNKYKKDYFERKVLVYYEYPFPEFKQNDMVSFVTVGNVLVEYTILQDEEPEQFEIQENNLTEEDL